MRGDLAKRELGMFAQWQQRKLYQQICQGSRPAEFIPHDGPPHANGDIHIGHAVNKTLKDIIIKSKTLAGFDAPLCAGLGLPRSADRAPDRKAARQNTSSRTSSASCAANTLKARSNGRRPTSCAWACWATGIVHTRPWIQDRGRYRRALGAIHKTATCSVAPSRFTGVRTAARRWPKPRWNTRQELAGDRRGLQGDSTTPRWARRLAWMSATRLLTR